MAQADTGARDRRDRAERGQRPGAGGTGGPLIDENLRPDDDSSVAGDSGVAGGPGVADDSGVAGGSGVTGDSGVSASLAATGAGADNPAGAGGQGAGEPPVLPPGQYIPRTLPVLHYGPIPVFHRQTWDLRIFGATESGGEVVLSWDDVEAMPVSQIAADFHCVTKFTVPGVLWGGVLAAEVLRRYPPAAAVTHVMIWADFGYSANIRISDFAADQTMLATHRDSEPLSPDHGYPLRLIVPHLYAWKSVKWIRALEYLTTDRRGFWEERGYHNTADPWREQRYSYQELDGEGPPL